VFTFTNNELEVCRRLCLGNPTAKQLAEESGLSLRAIYSILRSLEAKKVINVQGSRNRAFVPGDRLHALALRRFILEQGRPLSCISGGRLLVLLSISKVKKDRRRIAHETNLAQSSVRRLLNLLKSYGLIAQDGERFGVPANDPIISFLDDFSKGSCQALMEDMSDRGILRWYAGLEFIFSAPSLKDGAGAWSTGTTAMTERGLEFLRPTNHYWYGYWGRKPSTEEIAVHTIAMAPNDPRSVAEAMLLLKKEGFEPSAFIDEATWRGLRPTGVDIVDYLEGKGAPTMTAPDRETMESLLAQYGVQG